MTVTWAEILRACAEDDHAAYLNHAKLRRLASLLEQITPEMVATLASLNREAVFGEHGRGHLEDWRVSNAELHGLFALGPLLRSLSTAPTEETD